MRNSVSRTRGVSRRRHSDRTVIAARSGRKSSAGGARDVRALADELGVALVQAVRQGAVHDAAAAGAGHGSASISWHDFALDYLEKRWPQVAAKTRNETNDTLCAITQAMLRDVRGRPNDKLLRRALQDWAFVLPRPELHTAPPDVRRTLRWVARASRPVTDLMDPSVMRAVMRVLQLKQDGRSQLPRPETQAHDPRERSAIRDRAGEGGCVSLAGPLLTHLRPAHIP